MVRKQLRVLQSLVLSVFILGAGIQEAKAFLFLPPMPWDIEIDVPGNANKIVSNIQAAYRQAQTIKSELNSQKLEILKKGQAFLKTKFNKYTEKGKNKAPGKGELKNSDLLKITKGGLDEEENFNAFHTLFFIYPPKSSYPDNYPAVKQAYKRKADEYMQDIAMETYLTGRVTENYLALVEKTIERLDHCQKGMYTEDEMAEHCVFFGLQMAYVDPQKENLDSEGDPEDSTNPGQYGEVMNAYIVTTVYDRLMRIVEDLTGTEAQFISAAQINGVDPIEPENQSSAEDYIDTGYRFAYNESRGYTLATGTMLGGDYIRSQECENGGKNCPDKNEDKTEIKNTDDTKILGKIQPIDEQINQAMNLHNLKSQLAEYKTQYRKYLKAKEIHERMMKVLEKSEASVLSFLNRYSNGQGDSIWYGESKPSVVNDHEARGGLSKEVILEYQEDTTDKLIGTDSEECSGFYERCPDGYTYGEPCTYTDSTGKKVTSTTMFACVLDTVTSDMDPEGDPKVSYEPKLEKDYATVKNERVYNDTDYLKNGNQAEQIETDNRIKAEKNWRIGYDKIMKLTENGRLKFEPWNDQKNMQTEYLRNKYRNIRMIIKTADQGMLSQRVAKVLADKNGNIGPIKEVLPAVSVCELTTDATKLAFDKECRGYTGTCPETSGDVRTCTGTKIESCTAYDAEGALYHYTVPLTCTVTGDNNSGQITGSRQEGCTKVSVPISYSQTIKSPSGGCDFTKAAGSYEEIEDNSGECPGEWDLSTKFLVQRYIPGVTASWKNSGGYEATCQTDLDKQNAHLYENTHAAGRVVASDHFKEILDLRKQVEAELKAFIQQYEADVKSLKQQLENTITQRSLYGQKLSSYTDDKNAAVEERQRSLKRVAAIITQVDELEKRVEELQARLDERDPKPKSLQKEIESLTIGAGEDIDKFEDETKKATLAQKIGQIPALKVEFAYICEDAPVIENSEEGDDPYAICYSQKYTSDEILGQYGYLLEAGYKVYENKSTSDAESSDEEEDENEGEFQKVGNLHKTITEYNTKIDDAKAKMEVLQTQIDTLNQKLEETATKFAAKYIEKSEAGQAAIEEANKVFEEKLETKEDGSEPDRMVSDREWCKGYGPQGVVCRDGYSNEYKYDNLSWTMTRVMFGDGDSNSEEAVANELPGLVKDTINKRWFSNSTWVSKAADKLRDEGVVRKFVVEAGALAAYGVPDDVYTPETLAVKIKEKAVEEATAELAIGDNAYINKADKIIKDEIDAAVEEVTEVMEEFRVTGAEGSEANPAIYEHGNYAADGVAEGEQTITARHYQLLEDLKQAENPSILEAAEIDLQEVFGIPDNVATDDDYFASLPARGYYTGRNTFVQFGRDNEKFTFDENDGRDYRAPRKPLLNLAPVREVFYFSALDYDDVPQQEGKPSISALVDLKYKGTSDAVEYLPEVWRYLLATPNLRPGTEKYQHTFVERAYGLDKLKKYLNNEGIDGAEEWHYRAIIGRGGVYPCQLGGKYIDVAGGDNAGDIQFKQRSSIPVGVAKTEQCQEVQAYKNGVRHLLADHDAKDDSKSKALQGSLGSASEPMYTKYSELGQFLNGNLEYRPLLKNIYEYLLNEDNQENNIERQRADTAVFKRNLIGSFLEAVNAEHTALTSLEKNEKDVNDALQTLCKQLHNYGETVNGESGEEADSVCAQYIMDNGGLAKDSADDAYFEDAINCGQSNSGSYYETIFCKLNDLKDEAIKKALNGYTDEEGEYEGFNEVKSMEGSEKVTERIQNIQNYLDSFEEDQNEVTFIQPDSTPDDVKAAKEEALANREASLEATEEGLTSMDNQSQAVSYSPIY